MLRQVRGGQLMTGLASRSFAIRTVNLNGVCVGDGPPVIYLHGITANWAVWAPILSAMADRSLGVAVSQRGHGLSDKPGTGYSGRDYAEDALALVEALGAGPAILVGHSLGARNAVLAGFMRPDLVAGVLSIDFVPNSDVGALETLAERVNAGNRDFADRDEVRAYLQERYPLMPPDAVARRATYGYAAGADGRLRPLADADAMAQTASGLFEPYPDQYRQLQVPMIALRGAMSRLVPGAAFEDARRIRPDVDHLVIEGADHYIPEELPEVVTAQIDRLLA